MNPQTTTPDQDTLTERFRLTGEEALAQIQRLVHEGSVRRAHRQAPRWPYHRRISAPDRRGGRRFSSGVGRVRGCLGARHGLYD